MYYNPLDGLRFATRKEAKRHYGVANFRRLLRLKEIRFTTNYIANDELHYNPKTDQRDKE